MYNQKRLEGGRRFVYDVSEERPLITIITSTYNAVRDLPWTIDSIRAQTYSNIQWIVADGGSKDGTVELLEKNEDIIDFWFSAPDEGIYDAWTKALQFADGEWVQFIGAGDEIAEPDTLLNVAGYLESAYPDYELVYGMIDIISEERRRLLEHIKMPWGELEGKWHGIRPALPIHPEVFHHISIFKGLNFKHYTIAGDSFIMLSSILKKAPLFIDVLIDRMPHGGASTNPNNVKLIYDELKAINDILEVSPPLKNRVVFFCKVKVKVFLLSFFGYKVFSFFGDLFRFLTFKKRKWMVK